MERRKYKRVKNEYDVNIKINKSTDTIEKGKSINMSACGILIKYDKPIEIGSNISAKFLNQNTADYFESTAKVVRVEMAPDNTYEIGIELVELSEEDLNKLDNYLLSNEQEQNLENEENSFYIEIEIPEENQ